MIDASHARRPGATLRIAAAVTFALALAGCRTVDRPDDAAVEAFRAAVLAARGGDLDEAERLALVARDREPRLLDVHMLLARLAEERNDYEGARGYYRGVLAMDPAHTDAAVALGLTFLEEDRPDEAATWFRRAIEKDPRHEPALFNLAALLEQQGEAAEAADLYLRSAALAERDPRPLLAASRLQLQLGRRADAAESARGALERLEALHKPPQRLVDEAEQLLAEADAEAD